MRILVLDIDSLRPDHLGCYGYERDTSPTIDTLAEEGMRFDRCYASDTPCLPSRTALATCRMGINTGVVTHHGEGQRYNEPGEGHDPDANRVPAFRHLAENGIYTASVSQFSQRHLAYHFSANFQESIMPTATAGGPAVEDCSEVTPVAKSWLDQHATDDDWLLHVNYWDVHHPYLGIENFVDPVRESGPTPAWPDQETIDGQQEMTGIRTADLWPSASQYRPGWEEFYEYKMPDSVDSTADVDQFVDGYDASIRRVDAEVEKLLACLERHGVREETAVVITADHGEAFGEHGIYAEHAFPHPACQQVPMIVSWPGVTDAAAGTGTNAQVYQFDLLPTVCELAGIDIPTDWDAEPFTPALEGDEFSGRDVIVAGHGIYTYGRAVYQDEWMYVRLIHPGVFSYPGLYNDPGLPNDGLELLHNLDDDPNQTKNLVESRPEKTAEMRALLDRWIVTHLTDEWHSQQPVEARGMDPLARTASQGPYLYANPDELLKLYQEHGRSDTQIEALTRTMDAFPRER
ncbi:sulfatase [Natrialbaceae archaeon A-CW2]|uniref:sulfatase n=1 Tax=Natronosalvus amylolyticus TaxID=2961994 RepID=UPI0020C9E920|nr:sulfatase [Natronosalvus amylolyticus]